MNTQSLDAWEPEVASRRVPEESPKKDLFDMSKPPCWGCLAQDLLQRGQAVPTGCLAACHSPSSAHAG